MLTVRREDTQVAASNKLLVIETQDRVIGVQELGVEDDFDPVGASVEELDPPELVKNWVVGIVGHVVCGDRGERIALECKDSTFEEDLVFVREKGFGIGNFGTDLAVSWRGSRVKFWPSESGQ
jgi:hypothetical protein